MALEDPADCGLALSHMRATLPQSLFEIFHIPLAPAPVSLQPATLMAPATPFKSSKAFFKHLMIPANAAAVPEPRGQPWTAALQSVVKGRDSVVVHESVQAATPSCPLSNPQLPLFALNPDCSLLTRRESCHSSKEYALEGKVPSRQVGHAIEEVLDYSMPCCADLPSVDEIHPPAQSPTSD
ncbi:hypothetical protein B0H13DRAFT_2310416 [Mycena leptocephala]|nr:hypothetical protein B0H13DRAFT_2310416 [Mycena leptocephala]